jgi:hypothetical protein
MLVFEELGNYLRRGFVDLKRQLPFIAERESVIN